MPNKRIRTRIVLAGRVIALLLVIVLGSAVTADVGPDQTIDDADWDYWSESPHMFAMPAGNVAIGDRPHRNARLYVKTRNPMMDYAIYAEGAYGIKSVSTMWEGTGITGEGGHAGVAGNGFIGILGTGFYGGWFEGNGHFSGKLGIAQQDPEHALHVNGAINLDPIGEPAGPTTGFVIYCDAADGRLKAKSSGGTVTVLAEP